MFLPAGMKGACVLQRKGLTVSGVVCEWGGQEVMSERQRNERNRRPGLMRLHESGWKESEMEAKVVGRYEAALLVFVLDIRLYGFLLVCI